MANSSFHTLSADPEGIDPQCFELWLNGLNEEDAASKLMTQTFGTMLRGEDGKLLASLMRQEITDQYRVCKLIEPFLQQPEMLQRQHLIAVPEATQSYMLDQYYRFDESVWLQFVSKPLSGRQRRELTEIADATHTPLRSCRRQFDNLRNVLTAVEDNKDFNEAVPMIIRTTFFMSSKLSWQYSCAIFLMKHKFLLAKDRLAQLKWQDLYTCVAFVLVWFVPLMAQHAPVEDLIAACYVSPKESEGEDSKRELPISDAPSDLASPAFVFDYYFGQFLARRTPVSRKRNVATDVDPRLIIDGNLVSGLRKLRAQLAGSSQRATFTDHVLRRFGRRDESSERFMLDITKGILHVCTGLSTHQFREFFEVIMRLIVVSLFNWGVSDRGAAELFFIMTDELVPTHAPTNAGSRVSGAPTGLHLKADGTLDMRYQTSRDSLLVGRHVSTTEEDGVQVEHAHRSFQIHLKRFMGCISLCVRHLLRLYPSLAVDD